MTKTFTQNDMIRYFYWEMPENEAKEFQLLLESNPGFNSDYQVFKDTLQSLDGASMNAPKRVIENILAYSKSLITKSPAKQL